MILGEIDGHDIVFDKMLDTVFCKDITVKAANLITAYESPFDRENVEGSLVLRKFKTEITLGCFTLPIQKSNLLIRTIKKLRHARN